MKENYTWLANYYFRNKILSTKYLKKLETINVEPKYKEREVKRYTLKEYIELLVCKKRLSYLIAQCIQ